MYIKYDEKMSFTKTIDRGNGDVEYLKIDTAV